MGSMTSQKTRITASVERTGTAFPKFPPLKETDKAFPLYLSQTSEQIGLKVSLRGNDVPTNRRKGFLFNKLLIIIIIIIIIPRIIDALYTSI